MAQEREKTFLSTKEVAELLDVNEKVVYTLISEKGLPATKVTGKWLFPLHLVTRWVDTHVLNRPLEPAGTLDDDLLVIAGSNDLLLERVVARFNAVFSENLATFGSVGSLGGLQALDRNLCRIACAHLMHSDETEYNFAYLDRQLSGPRPVVVNFCHREQGLLVASGNPKSIDGIPALCDRNIVMVNRSPATGTRLLLDHELQKHGVSGEQIPGYDNELPTHLAVGLEILAGRADVGPGIKTVATLLGLDFVPLRQERFDLLIHKSRFFDKPVQRFLGLLQDDAFREMAAALDGYDIRNSGKVVYPDSD
ncbi:substrate-binding domain-containing protein [Desulfolithobacter sp.]